MMNNRAGWLALSVLAAATLLMVFFVLPRISNEAKPVGEAINAAGTAIKEAVTEGGAAERELVEPPAVAEKAVKPAEPAPGQTAANQPATQSAQQQQPASPVMPSFDVLRVEPNGSTVIAGSAEPGSKLEISDGTTVIAKVDVGPSGDFAAVLDTPLKPGEHELVLKATGSDGRSVTSEETATVSIPQDRAGKLLTMVTKPGKASRLLNVPGTEAPAGQPATGAITAPTAETAAASPSPAAGSTPALPEASSGLVASAPPIPAAPSAAAGAVAPELAQALKVTAVEIEGSKIFVAGLAKPNASLRGEADGKPIGKATADGNGHFVIEGTADLTIGDHTISVETVGPNGQVQLRVEVPFNRPSGEQIAAVAGPRSSQELSPIDGGAFDKLRNDVARAFDILRGLYADGREPSMEELAAARSATGIALKSLSEYRVPVDAIPSVKAIAEKTAVEASKALAALDTLPKEINAVGTGLAGISDMIAQAIGPVIAKGLEESETAAAEPAAATPAPQTAPAAAESAAGTPTIAQAPLTPSEQNSVIIRRGDTLWQISRRIYGQGVRYTTIYLANQDKIANPDIIQPGQTFEVPNEALPDAEEVHRTRLRQKS